MSELGNYVTNAYEILKLIFSHLSSKDLNSAAKVCVEWKDVAKRVQVENNTIEIFNKMKLGTQSMTWKTGWDTINDKVQPKIILHLSINNKCPKEFAELLSETYHIDRPVFSLLNHRYITSIIRNGQVEIWNEVGRHSEAIFILPELPGAEIESFSLNYRDPISVSKDRCEKLLNQSKCCLLLVNAHPGNAKYMIKFLASLKNPEALVLAGGVSATLDKYEKEKESGILERDNNQNFILGITFSGENVSAHCEVHYPSTAPDNFMKSFAEKVGPAPEGAIRMAFMFVCVKREGWFQQEETEIFAKHFPKVPVIGFWSLGEFCTQRIEGRMSKKLKTDKAGFVPTPSFKFFHEGCTSYLVVTIRKPA